MSDPRPTPEDELIERIRSIDVRAPESLHRKVESMIADKTRGLAKAARSASGRGSPPVERSRRSLSRWRSSSA